MVYEIRYLKHPFYYCILWVSIGQNIFISKLHGYREIKEYEKGNSKFKSLKDLHSYLLNRYYKV